MNLRTLCVVAWLVGCGANAGNPPAVDAGADRAGFAQDGATCPHYPVDAGIGLTSNPAQVIEELYAEQALNTPVGGCQSLPDPSGCALFWQTMEGAGAECGGSSSPLCPPCTTAYVQSLITQMCGSPYLAEAQPFVPCYDDLCHGYTGTLPHACVDAGTP